ncbi:MAG: response regulator, partial [Saprospiraceae bacterium]
MKEYRTIVIEDDVRIRESMLKMLSTFEEIVVVGESDGVEAGLQLINKQVPDILLLDLELVDGTGFDILDKLQDEKTQVVVVTGHESFAYKTIESEVTDCLLKPISRPSLQLSLLKAFKNLDAFSAKDDMEEMFFENNRL